MSDRSLMIVAGERSGDILGAELARALHERLADLKLFGCGGDAMRQAGVDTVVDAHRLTMMGITEVISGLPRAYRALQTLVAEVDRRRPQLAVLIDFPDFNLRLAKRLKQRGVRVVYFVSHRSGRGGGAVCASSKLVSKRCSAFSISRRPFIARPGFPSSTLGTQWWTWCGRI